jgi:hypothetical protein
MALELRGGGSSAATTVMANTVDDSIVVCVREGKDGDLL